MYNKVAVVYTVMHSPDKIIHDNHNFFNQPCFIKTMKI